MIIYLLGMLIMWITLLAYNEEVKTKKSKLTKAQIFFSVIGWPILTGVMIGLVMGEQQNKIDGKY